MLSLVWWIAVAVAAIMAQSQVPGVDFLAAGFVLALQEERWTKSLWFALACILIQEGSGSLAFGSELIWYGTLAAMYFFGHYLFEARNFLFMIILGVCLGAMHILLTHMMASLQDWFVAPERLWLEAIVQAVVFPMEWGLLFIMYNNLPLRHVRNI
jgi:hypothetical protein